METDLFDLIKKSSDKIDTYLGDVSTTDFVADVKRLVTQNISKTAIEDTIKSLQSLIS